MTPTQAGGSSNSTTADSAVQAPADAYMLTLCGLASPITVKPPQSPHLKKFKFFTSRSRHSDGSERLYLHMGYFGTLAAAESWAQLMRRVYPKAVASRVPGALLSQLNSGVPTLQPAQGESAPLTDTMVLNILETRRVSTAIAADDSRDGNGSDISLLRPDDTDTRKILKEAVAQNAPVSFALQLNWSVQPIDLNSVPLLSIFKAYTLYCTEAQREGRAWYSLRLGFFDDAISAKQVASYVRSTFASVAVVPVTDDERTHAGNARIDTTTLTDTFGQQFDQALNANAAPEAKSAAKPAAKPAAAVSAPPRTGLRASSNGIASNATPNRGTKETLEQTLEMLATREMWQDDESLSETGVRHLTIQVQKSSSRR